MRHKSIILIFLAVVISSTILKLGLLHVYDVLPLYGDAGGFLDLSKEMTSFYDASKREPAWILWTKFVSSITPKPETGMRLGNILLSTLSGIMLFLILYKKISILPALAGSSLYFFIPYLIYSPIRAHRFEMYIAILLFCTYLLLSKDKYSNTAFLGTAMGILILVRIESVIFLILVSVYFALKKTDLKKLYVLSILLVPAISISGPFFYSCYKSKGTPFYILDIHSKFYTHHEKAVIDKTISENEALDVPYDTMNTNVLQYVFNRDPVQIITRFTGGYWEAITAIAKHLMSTPVNLSFFIYPIWAGLFISFFIKKIRPLLVIFLLYILPHSFILSTRVATRSSIDIRLGASVPPLMALSFACFYIGCVFFVKYVKNSLKKNS